MADRVFDAQGGTTMDVALTTGNLAIQGSTAQQFTPSSAGTGSIKMRNAASGVAGAPIHGTQSYHFEGPASGDTATATANEPGTTTTQKRQAVTLYHPAAPTGADQTIMTFQGSSGPCMSVIHRTTGRIAIVNANAGTTVWVSPNDASGILTYPCTVTYDADLDVGTQGSANTGDGKAHLNIYKHSVSTATPWQSSGAAAEGNNYYRTGYIASCRVGKQTTTGVMSFVADSWRVKDGVGLQGTVENPVNTPPVVSIPGAASQSKVTGDSVSFTAAATDAEGNAVTWSWTNDTRPSGASAPSLSGANTATMTASGITVPGIYTFKVKANDGTTDSNTVTVTAFYAAADGSVSVASRRAGSAYIGAVSNLNDSSDGTVVISPDGAAGAVEVWNMNPVKAGDAFTTVGNALTLRMRKRAADGTSDTTATITVKVEVLTGTSDTAIAERTFTLTNTLTPCQIQFTSQESAAFTDHNTWAIRVTTTQA